MRITNRFLFRAAGMVLCCAALALFSSSCSVWDWFMARTSDEEVDELDKSLGAPDKRVTAYEKALEQFGLMIEAYNIPNVKVQSKPIKNHTAEKGLPDDIRSMVETSLNKITRQIMLIPYDPSYYTAEVTTGGRIDRTLPDIVIDGGLTEFDKDMIEKQRELKAEAQIKEGDYGSKFDYDGGAGYEAKSGVSRLGLDVHLLNYATQAAIAGKQSSNVINIRKTSLGWSVGAYFQGCGLSFEYALKRQQGLHSAIRLLVELSVLEVLGKYFDVPYWRCIEGAKPDEAMVARMTEEYNDADDATKNAYLKEYLFLHGYEGFDRSKSFFDENEKKSLAEASSKLGASSNTDLFMKLWSSVPIDEARKRVREYRKFAEQQRLAQLQAQAEAQRKAQLEAQQRQLEAQKLAEAQAKAVAGSPKAQEQPAVPVAKTAKPTKADSKEKPIGIGSLDEF